LQRSVIAWKKSSILAVTRRVWVHRWLDALVLASFGAVLPAVALGNCVVGQDIPWGSLAAGNVDPAVLAAINDTIDAGRYDVRALLVVRDCKLVFERYKTGLSRDHSHTTYSVTKSFVTTIAGHLEMGGALRSLDLPITSLVRRPPAASDDLWRKAERITLRHALGMTSGLLFRNDPELNSGLYRAESDRLYEALKSPLANEPGTVFNYSDGDASLYGAAVASAGDADLLALAQRTLFSPMNFRNYQWSHRDREGRYPGGWGLRLRAMDMAKLGQLYLQNGRWNGSLLFSGDFRQRAWTSGPSPKYGLGWWLDVDNPAVDETRLFVAAGLKGQRIFVYPTLDLIAVVISSLTPLEEVRLLDGVAVQMGRAARRGYRPNPGAEQRLTAALARGFDGLTRVRQQEQDAPSP
jgi:CubicO group peptidase (beta-lactamase class C family)